jgi:hypothetical protein
LRWNRRRSAVFGLLLCAAPPALPAQDSTVIVTGITVDSTSGSAIPGVAVYTLPLRPTVLTDALGQFRLTLPTSSVEILLRRIGYAPRTVPLPAPARGSRLIELDTVLLKPIPIVIDSIGVLVEADRNSPWLSEFYRRKQTGAGRYLTPVDQIVAIEVYDSSIWAPPGYRGCVILLWSEPPE